MNGKLKNKNFKKQKIINVKGEKMRIGIWLGFPTYTPMKREGIGRFILYLTKHILKNYNVAFEIWIYEINRYECESLFKELLNGKKYQHRINILRQAIFQISN